MSRLVLGIGGASGALYAKRLMEKLIVLTDQWENVGVVISENGIKNWELEIGDFNPDEFPFEFYAFSDFQAPFASGSAKYNCMIVCPCSMGTLSRIALGISGDLLTRAADVMLKERRKLILVPRETPLNLIHIDNMRRVTEAGAIVCPASPSFYSHPNSINEMVDTVVDRILDLAGFQLQTYRWNSKD